ncbi:VOC family protein [Leptobacterium flavescens]|uniref:Bleomycin resistance protein n=2 Tax=Leptobacterium flavescens TaxID=472055 RepID=A0A6P0UWW6_9FLAO|nr:VOC family protein [Leptobacterium flavescens]
MKHLQRGIPVLASLNIAKTVAFYKNKLGFDKQGYMDENYAVLARDKVEIHFWKCDDKIHPENTSCYVRVQDIDTLYKEMQAAEVVHPRGAIEDKPYGIREFAIVDLDGNLIKFGEYLQH